MNNQSVINAFICGKSASSSNRNLRSYGNKLVSYYTTIAERLADGTIVLNRTKYSVSTSKIQTWLLYSVIESGLQYKEVCNVPLGGYKLETYL
jgi:hypothetical protein